MKIRLEGQESILDTLDLTSKEIQRGLRNTVSATATALKRFAADEISKETGLKKTNVNKHISVTRPTQAKIEAIVSPLTKRISISSYTPKITYRGSRGTAFADISMIRAVQKLENRIFSNPVKKKVVFQREGETAYPIKGATGPSVNHHFGRIIDKVLAEGRKQVIELFIKKLEDQIRKRR